MSVDRSIWIIKIKWGIWLCQFKVCFIKRVHRSNISPVVIKVIPKDSLVMINRVGNDIAPEIIVIRVIRQ